MILTYKIICWYMQYIFMTRALYGHVTSLEVYASSLVHRIGPKKFQVLGLHLVLDFECWLIGWDFVIHFSNSNVNGSYLYCNRKIVLIGLIKHNNNGKQVITTPKVGGNSESKWAMLNYLFTYTYLKLLMICFSRVIRNVGFKSSHISILCIVPILSDVSEEMISYLFSDDPLDRY